MAFRFDKLWELMQERGISKEQLRVGCRASQNTIVKMGSNGYVSLDVIDRICKFLQCSIDDIMEHIPEEDPAIKERGQMARGDVYLCATSQDAADNKVQRAVVILQSTSLCKNVASICVAPVITEAKLEYPFCVNIGDFNMTGCSRMLGRAYPDCYVAFSQIRQMPMVLFQHKIGSLAPEVMDRLDQALKVLLDLA